jgi:hypothetical protein
MKIYRAGAVVKALPFALVALLIGCSGSNSSPAAPSPAPAPAPAPSPPPLPTATLQLSGQGSFVNCLALIGRCDFQASIENAGQGCATGAAVVARFFDGAGGQLGSDVQMGAVGSSLASRTIRPGEIVAILSIAGVPLTVRDNMRSFRLFPTWTDTRCP